LNETGCIIGNGQRVQDVDRVTDIQALSEPTWRGGVRMQDKPLGIVERP